MAWATRELARADWADAPTDDDQLDRLLEDATTQCAAFAPALAEDAEPPPGWQRAVVLQARELWAAARRDGDVIGVTDTYAITARPLTSSVRALLRPRRAVPRVR